MSETKRLRAIAVKAVRHWKNRLMSRSWERWVEHLMEMQMLQMKAYKALSMWVHNLLSKAWRVWQDIWLEMKEGNTGTELERLRRMLARQALLKWMHGCEAKTWNKWRQEVVRTRKTMKAIKMWKNRAMGRAWRAWALYVMEKKRLRFAGQKVVARWKVTFVFVSLSILLWGMASGLICVHANHLHLHVPADACINIKRSPCSYACVHACRMAHVRRPWESGMTRWCVRERRERLR